MSQPPPSIDELTKQLIEFRDARDWRQFHSLKDLILSLSLEASELLELTQWKSEQQFEEEKPTAKNTAWISRAVPLVSTTNFNRRCT